MACGRLSGTFRRQRATAVMRRSLRKIGARHQLEIVKATSEKRPGAREGGALATVVPTEVDGEEVWLTKVRLALV